MLLKAQMQARRSRVFERYAGMAVPNKLKVTTVTLKCTTMDGREIRDEFLGFFPGVEFGPPQISDSPGLSQDQLNRFWDNPNQQIVLGASYTSDHYELADEIREWARDPARPFPLGITSGSPPSPIFKTRFETRKLSTHRPIMVR